MSAINKIMLNLGAYLDASEVEDIKAFVLYAAAQFRVGVSPLDQGFPTKLLSMQMQADQAKLNSN